MSRGNSDDFIKQLDIVLEAYREKRLITLYLHNARWHKTRSVYAWKKPNPSFKLAYLPKYAPEIDPLEKHWGYLRKKQYKMCCLRRWDNAGMYNAHFIGLDQEK